MSTKSETFAAPAKLSCGAGEPVAWLREDLILPGGRNVIFDREHAERSALRTDEWRVTPLYTTPPAEPAVVPAEAPITEFVRCPSCRMNWTLFPPAKCAGSDHVRCVECKSTFPKEPAPVADDLVERTARRLPSLSRALYEEYPAMSAQAHEGEVKAYARSVSIADAAVIAELQAELADYNDERGRDLSEALAVIAGKDAEISDLIEKWDLACRAHQQDIDRAIAAEARITDLQAEVGRSYSDGWQAAINAAAEKADAYDQSPGDDTPMGPIMVAQVQVAQSISAAIRGLVQPDKGVLPVSELWRVAYAAKEFCDDWKKGDFSLPTLAALDAQSLAGALEALSDATAALNAGERDAQG